VGFIEASDTEPGLRPGPVWLQPCADLCPAFCLQAARTRNPSRGGAGIEVSCNMKTVDVQDVSQLLQNTTSTPGSTRFRHFVLFAFTHDQEPLCSFCFLRTFRTVLRNRTSPQLDIKTSCTAPGSAHAANTVVTHEDSRAVLQFLAPEPLGSGRARPLWFQHVARM